MSHNNITALYYFMNEEVSLVEIKRTDIDTDDKSKLFYWLKLLKSSNQLERLEFKSMSSEIVNDNNINIRVFEDGELRFDNDFAKLLHKTEGHIVMNKPVSEIPAELMKRLSEYLEELN